jgi:streptogramin lyase
MVTLPRDHRARRWTAVVAAAAVLSCVGAAGSAGAALVGAGDVLVAGAGLISLDPATGLQHAVPICSHCPEPSAVAFGKDVFFLDRFGTYRLISETARPRLLAKRLVACDVESAPGGTLVVAHCDGTLRRVDPVTGVQTTMLTLPADTPPHFQIAFSPSGDLYLASRKGIVRLRPALQDGGTIVAADPGVEDLVVGKHGELFVLQAQRRVLRIDSLTGEQTVAFDAGSTAEVVSMSVAIDGALLVATIDYGQGDASSRVLRVDAATGSAALVADLGAVYVRAVAGLADGSVLVATGRGLVQVTPAGESVSLSPRRYVHVSVGSAGELLALRPGNRDPAKGEPRPRFVRVGTGGLPDTTLSPLEPTAEALALTRSGDVLVANGAAGVLRISSAIRRPEELASGGQLVAPAGIALGPPGEIYVADPAAGGGHGAVIRVDLRTGAQRIVSAGGAFVRPVAVAVARNGHILVADAGAGAVIEVDPVTGSQSVRASGGTLASPTGIAVLPRGDVLVADPEGREGAGAVVRIDASGTQTLLATGAPYRSLAVISSSDGQPVSTASPRVVGETLPEICGNCLDDNGDGTVDYEDPSCCRSTQPTRGRWRTSGSGKHRLHLRAQFFADDPRVEAITVQIREARGPLRCQVLEPSAWRVAPRGFALPENGDAEGFKAGRLSETSPGRSRLELVSRKGIVRGLRPPALGVTLHAGGMCAAGVLRFGGGPRPAPPSAPLCE